MLKIIARVAMILFSLCGIRLYVPKKFLFVSFHDNRLHENIGKLYT